MNKFVKIAVLAGTFVILAGDVYYVQHNGRTTSEQAVALDSKINDLQNELKKLSEQKEETKETIEVKLKNAVNAGKEVANLQNNYAKLNVKANDKSIEENAEKLRKFFTKDTTNAGVPWLYINKDYIQGKREPNWEFVTTYGFNPGKVDTLWINRDKQSGEIYAYTTAVYDSETGLFSQIKKVSTPNTGALIGTNEQDTRSAAQKEADRKKAGGN